MDASAARGIANSQGVGKIRHLECKTLWLQQKVKDGIVKVFAVSGNDNSADLGTKVLTANRIHYLAEQIGLYDGETMQLIRETAVKVSQVVTKGCSVGGNGAITALVTALIAFLQVPASGHLIDHSIVPAMPLQVDTCAAQQPRSFDDLIWLARAVSCIFLFGSMLGAFCMHRHMRRVAARAAEREGINRDAEQGDRQQRQQREKSSCSSCRSCCSSFWCCL